MSKIFNIELKRSGLNTMQKAILRTLEAAGKPLSMRQFEEKLDKKRLTILYNLQKLQKRGWVEQARTQRIYTWSLQWKERKDGGSEISADTAYEILAKTPAKRLWGIQGAGAAEKLIRLMRRGVTYKPTHHRQRLRQVIVDGILTARGVELLKQAPKGELASHLRRPTILHITADTPELENLEIITDGKTLFVIDRERDRTTATKDANLVAAYLGLHETLKSLSPKVRPQEVYGEA